jgi:hypothetical protein
VSAVQQVVTGPRRREKSRRDPPESFGGFLHADDAVTVDPVGGRVTRIAGAAVEGRVYHTGVLFMALTGVDDIAPLVAWARANPHLLPGPPGPPPHARSGSGRLWQPRGDGLGDQIGQTAVCGV